MSDPHGPLRRMGDWRERLTKLGASQLGLITRTQLFEAGMSERGIERRLGSGSLVGLRRRVYVLPGGPPFTAHQKVLAVCLSLGPNVFASHATAAWLWGLDRYTEASKSIEVSVPHGKNVSLEGVVSHQRPPIAEGHMIRDCVPVTILARTLLDLTPSLNDVDLEVVLDSAGRNRFGYFHDLAEFLGQFRGKKGRGHEGIDRLHHLVQLRRGNEATGSIVETNVLQVLRRAGIEDPFTQHPILTRGDRLLCLADFAWPRLKIALFSDSNYRLGKRARLDAMQRLELQKLGWRPFVVFKKMLEDRRWISAFAELFHPVIP